MSEFIQIYKQNLSAENAFLIVEGDVLFYLNESDKYAMKGNNFIIGAEELLLNNYFDLGVNRLETAVIYKKTKLKKISKENLLNSINKYSFLVNIAMGIAKKVVLVNQIINRYTKELSSSNDEYKSSCMGYYKIVSEIKEEYSKRKLPWLKEVIEKYETSLTYAKGEIFCKSPESVKIIPDQDLSDKSLTFEKDSIICEQGEEGNSLFILQDGTIDILINGEKVASLNDQGTAIGEIALFLGEKRSATLKARNRVIVTKLEKSDLKEIAEKDISILQGIVNSLAQKHYNNFILLRDLNEKILEKQLDTTESDVKKEAQSRQKCITEYGALKKTISDVIYQKKADFLQDRFSQLLK